MIMENSNKKLGTASMRFGNNGSRANKNIFETIATTVIKLNRFSVYSSSKHFMNKKMLCEYPDRLLGCV